MGMLIKKVVYHGDKYYFESPELEDGIVILEGDNEHGKSTFMDLIFYGLGGKVPGFDKSDKDSEKHTEIYNDKNNYVELSIEINEKKYELTRPFIKKENKIYILDQDENIIETNIYRGSDDDNIIFSDWILDKLGIEVFDIIQGTKKFKIGFSDLMRLIYHDQKTEIDKIYKKPENENFVSDSLEIRRAIFEVLIGEVYTDYYSTLGKYKLKNREFDEQNAILKSYNNFLNEITSEEIENVESLQEKIAKMKDTLSRIEIERELARTEKCDSNKILEEVDRQRNKLVNKENEKMNFLKIEKTIQESIDKILFLIDKADKEIKEIENIRFVNKKLAFFSPNTCPYCLREVEREYGKCICGNKIDEEEYEKFFYSEEEYFEILKVKKKSKKSLKMLLEKKNNRLADVKNNINLVNILINNIKKYINDLLKDFGSDYNSAYIYRIDNRIKEINTDISKLEEIMELAKKKQKIIKSISSIRAELGKLKVSVNTKLSKAQQDMLEKRDEFNDIYFKLMKKTDKYCYDAYIGEDYMPYTNNNSYRARSSLVTKRLMYFLTLLILSVEHSINYPRFLMIDTPNKEGIDRENLINVLDQLRKVDEYKENSKIKYQIILTTGIGIYPEELKKYVFLTLENDNKLLIEK